MILSELPENIIDDILCRLPIKDVVRTGILSHSWRHRWKSIDELDLTGIPDVVVSGVLSQCTAPIRVFIAKVDCSSTLDVCLDILSSHSASTLRILDLSSVEHDHDHNGSVSYDVSLNFHYIGRLFPRLTHLQLSSFRLHCNQPDDDDDDDFPRFTTLRTLNVNFCELCGRFSAAISACPVLETLNVDMVQTDAQESLYIAAPNLRYLNIFGAIFHVRPSDFSIITAPILEKAIICFEAYEDCNLMKVLGGMPNIRKLYLGSITLEFLSMGSIPHRIPIRFNHLWRVSLCGNFGDAKQALITLCLLRSTPNLQKLRIKHISDDDEGNELVLEQGFWEAQEYVGLFCNLETIKMNNCIESMLDFLKIVLAKAQELKVVEIHFSGLISNKELAMMKILDFPMISNQAQILFTHDDDQGEEP